MSIAVGLTAQTEHVVGVDDTASALGSGDLAVLATPRLLAWCEQTTCAAIADHLDAGSTSVGTRVSLEHSAASAVGQPIACTATVTYAEGRLLTFQVVAVDGTGRAVATGEVRRVVVRRDRFLDRLAPSPTR